MKSLSEIKAYKPRMKAVENVEDLPFPCVATAKADGEFSVVVFSEADCYTCNKNGRIRGSNFKAIRETARSLTWRGIKNAVFLAELYGVVDGRPQNLPYFNSHKNDMDLHLGFFDVVSVNGERADKYDYLRRMRMLDNFFKGNQYAKPLPYRVVENRVEAREFWMAFVDALGYEGVIAQARGDIYKVKPLRDLDAVVIGVNKKPKLKENLVTSLKLALIDSEGRFVDVGDVASGITHRLREELFSLIKTRTQEDRYTIFIEPNFVVQIQFNETYTAEKTMRIFRGGRYMTVKTVDFYSLRHPRLIRFRDDKEPINTDVGTDQLEG